MTTSPLNCTCHVFPPPTAPAIVEPGENTTTEVPEDGFRFFQTECLAFSLTILIEQVDIRGRCNLYASNHVKNPGPLDNSTVVVRNETAVVGSRSVLLHFKKGIKKVIIILHIATVVVLKELHVYTCLNLF